jgi:hypothetical protein
MSISRTAAVEVLLGLPPPYRMSMDQGHVFLVQLESKRYNKHTPKVNHYEDMDALRIKVSDRISV